MIRIAHVIGCFLLLGWQIGYASSRVCEKVVLYSSIDQHGDSLTLSGKVSIPVNTPAKGIILLTHYTIASNQEVPSACTPYEAKPLRDNYVLIMPDYIGYGATSDRFPPYLHGELTARNCVDMLPVAQAIMDSMQVNLLCDSLHIVGFSQGAATALWTLKLLEEQYSEQIHLKQCMIGSGPYDVAATYDVSVAHNKTGMPMAIPLLVLGTNTAYDLQLDYERIFTPTMNSQVDKYIVSKKYGLISLAMRMPNHAVSHWLSEYGRDKTQPETKRMYEGFLRSSLVHYPVDDCPVGAESILPDWTPETPLFVFHSTKDDIVPFRNAEHLRRYYADVPTITWDLGNYGGHLKSLFVFLSRVKEQLK